MREIKRIHGTSSQITFDCEDTVITGSGEFLAGSGKIDGFVLYAGSLQYPDGTYLTEEERKELEQSYREYAGDRADRIEWEQVPCADAECGESEKEE